MSFNPKKLYDFLIQNKIDFFSGVPDSLLKEFCLCIDNNSNNKEHIIAANEGNAIAHAAGYYLGTGRIPFVYMQNSGLGNAINPLLSLCDKEVYSIPLLMMIGWRGEPSVNDEPQHVKQGKIQLDLLESMGIKYFIIDGNWGNSKNNISKAMLYAENKKEPVALVVKKETFAKFEGRNLKKSENEKLMLRETALEILINNLPKDIVVVSTTGKTSREIFEIREKMGDNHSKDFLTVGSMGHCSSIALGIAIAKPNKKIVCIDGDGSLLMHLGSLSTIAKINPDNFYHILVNNKAHDSVGGQETSIRYIDTLNVIKANKYKNIFSVDNEVDLKIITRDFLSNKGPSFLEIKVKIGSRFDLGRPNIKPSDNKKNFMKYVLKNDK
tara:strand:- start:2117 stop:3262 length:1146 start_codon:yes stop_codon:yes gene_type:complete